MAAIDPEGFRFALGLIRDGNIFEKLALDFLAKVIGYQFIPAGGLHDRGIDGMEHTFHRKVFDRAIYQASIEKDAARKIRNTLDKLQSNLIDFSQFIYVTNIPVPQKERLADMLMERYQKSIVIYDVDWFAAHVNDSEATMRTYGIFIDSYLQEFRKPGRAYEIADLEGDPRLYVFLRQQWEQHKGEQDLDKVLVDALILFALEGTDPDQGILRTRDEILERVRDYVKFEASPLVSLIDDRLKALSSKPVQRINCHKQENAYCLRYEERLAIQQYNINDAALYEDFNSHTMKDIATFIPIHILPPEHGTGLVQQLLHSLFREQGLEFAEYVLHGTSEHVMDKSLTERVSEIVDHDTKVISNRAAVKSGLVATVRNMVYRGSRAQKVFLRRLSNTYMLLFLLQCEPQLCTFFSSLAGKLRVYACTSIIIPALSEQFLEQKNRRFANLLVGAAQAGVKLCINEAILKELAAHFRMIRNTYRDFYKDNEDLYTDEVEIVYVQEIMIRAYFYSRLRGQIKNFDHFIGTFVSPSMNRLEDDLVAWLNGEFGIEYVANESLGVHLDPGEIADIQANLEKYKGQQEKGRQEKARTDAEVILTIHAIRELHNELGTGEIFGYRTWWLSSDVTTMKAAVEALGEKYATSCYMRPDFLYNYISIAPSKGQIGEAFGELFPTLLGVNISHHVPGEVTEAVHRFVKEHKEINRTRLKGKLRELTDHLKQHPSIRTGNRVRLYLDDLKLEFKQWQV